MSAARTVLVVLIGVCCASAMAAIQRQSHDAVDSTSAKAVSTAATKPLTGLAEAGCGFNAYTVESGLLPVINWTFASGKSWTSPVSKLAYPVPDQLTAYSPFTSNTNTANGLSVDVSFAQYKYSSNFNLDAGAILGVNESVSASVSTAVKAVEYYIGGGIMTFGWNEFQRVDYELNAWPSFALQNHLTTAFTELVASLPTSMSSATEKSAYQAAAAKMGTHYVCRGAFGGSVTQVQFLEKSIAVEFGISVSTAQMGIKFHKDFAKISAGIWAIAADIHLQTWFSSHVKHENVWKGGNKTFWNNASLVSDWVKSVPDEAALVRGTLCPLADLMDAYPSQQANYRQLVAEMLPPKSESERLRQQRGRLG